MNTRFIADNLVEVAKNLSEAIDNYKEVYKLALKDPVVRMTTTETEFYELTSKKLSIEQMREHLRNITTVIKN